MKIHKDEIDAYCRSYESCNNSEEYCVQRALEAAYTVRRARKQAKRERQRKEKDNTIQKLAADMMTWCGKTLPEMTTDELVSARDELAGFESMSLRENGFYHRMNAEITARKEKDKQVQDSAKGEIVKPSESAIEAMYRAHGYSVPSKAPEWDGKFGVGEWQTWDGDLATVTSVQPDYLMGNLCGLSWTWNLDGTLKSPNDGNRLCRPWPKGEQ